MSRGRGGRSIDAARDGTRPRSTWAWDGPARFRGHGVWDCPPRRRPSPLGAPCTASRSSAFTARVGNTCAGAAGRGHEVPSTSRPLTHPFLWAPRVLARRIREWLTECSPKPLAARPPNRADRRRGDRRAPAAAGVAGIQAGPLGGDACSCAVLRDSSTCRSRLRLERWLLTSRGLVLSLVLLALLVCVAARAGAGRGLRCRPALCCWSWSITGWRCRPLPASRGAR